MPVSGQLQEAALECLAGAQVAALIQFAHFFQQRQNVGEILFVEDEVQVLLVLERRQLRQVLDGQVFQVQRIAIQMRQEKRLGKIDQDEIAVLRMRDQVQAMGQDKRQGPSWVRPDGAADVLHGIAAQVDLDLEVVVSVWGDNGRACLLVTNIEVRAVAALLHAIGAHA